MENEFQQNLSKLRSIWNALGIGEDQRRRRMQIAMDHLRHLMEDMVDEETGLLQQVQNNINERKLIILWPNCKKRHR